MAGNETPEEAIEAARVLAEEARAIRRALDTLTVRDARRRIQMWTITALATVGVVLTGAMAYTFHKVTQAGDATVELCEVRNRGLQDQRRLWEGLLVLPRAPDARPPNPETIAAFRRLLDESLKLEDCSGLNGKGGA